MRQECAQYIIIFQLLYKFEWSQFIDLFLLFCFNYFHHSIFHIKIHLKCMAKLGVSFFAIDGELRNRCLFYELLVCGKPI